MPSISDAPAKAHFYGFRNVTHARKLLRLCLRLGYRPSVVFTVSRTGAYIAALGDGMPDLYIRIRNLREGLLDWAIAPHLLARGLKGRAEKAFRRHVSSPARGPLEVAFPALPPAQ